MGETQDKVKSVGSRRQTITDSKGFSSKYLKLSLFLQLPLRLWTWIKSPWIKAETNPMFDSDITALTVIPHRGFSSAATWTGHYSTRAQEERSNPMAWKTGILSRGYWCPWDCFAHQIFIHLCSLNIYTAWVQLHFYSPELKQWGLNHHIVSVGQWLTFELLLRLPGRCR